MTSSPPVHTPADTVGDDPGTGHSRWLILVVVCLAQFMVVLDATIVNVAIFDIKNDLDFSDADLSWVINSYTLVFGGFLMLGGRAADLLGRRRLFMAGVVVFSLASLLNGFAQTDTMLIISRGLQGLGGALVSPAALSIIMTSFADGPDRTKALGVWSAIAAGGAAFGLLLGGVLTQSLSWEWVFFVNVPVGIATIMLALRYVPESRAEVDHRHFDVGGAITVTGGLMLLVYAIIGTAEHGWTSTRTIALVAGAIALLIAFVVIELRSKAPLIDLAMFRRRSLSVANSTMLLVAGGMFSMFFFATLYMQNPALLGYGPMKTGLAFLPVTFGIGIGAALAQPLVRNLGVRNVALLGLAVAAVGLSLEAISIDVDGTYLQLLMGLLPMSIGMGLTFVPMTLIATTGIPDEEAGAASGVFNTSQQIGGSLGLAVLATLSADRAAEYIKSLKAQPTSIDAVTAQIEGFQTAFWGSAIMMIVGLVFVATMLRDKDVAGVDVNTTLVP